MKHKLLDVFVDVFPFGNHLAGGVIGAQERNRLDRILLRNGRFPFGNVDLEYRVFGVLGEGVQPGRQISTSRSPVGGKLNDVNATRHQVGYHVYRGPGLVDELVDRTLSGSRHSHRSGRSR